VSCGEKASLEQCPLEGSEKLNSLQVPLQTILSQTAKKVPEKIAIIDGNQKVTYHQLDDFSSRFASALVDCGVKRGCRVSLFLPNSLSFVIAYFGVLKAGGVVTVVSPLHKELEVERQLCDSGAQTIVVLESLYPIVEKIMAKTLLKNVIITVLEGKKFKASGVRTCLNIFDFWDLIRKSVVVSLGFRFSPEEDLAALQYTSGTAGVPKGVMLSHTNLVSNVLSFASWIKGVSEDVFLAVLPFSHVYGMTTSMLTPISLGAEMVLLPKFDQVKCLQTIKRHKVTVFCGSPTMYSMLLGEFEKYDLSSVRVCISGASRLSRHVQERFMQAGVFLVEGYGLTEASPVTHCTPVDKLRGPVKVGSVGLALLGTDMRIVDAETGCRVVAVGECGELCVRGLQVMRGYWQNPVETMRVLCDGWLLTGDIAYRDSEGYVYIVDRKKHLIKHKDYSVCPKELEDVLCGHPAVKMCTVIGKPNVLVGEIPKAFVVLKDGEVKVTEGELVGFVNGKVAGYKALGEVEFCRNLPQGLRGKVLK
jgi:long-chain acyl-CoA synthetase